MTDLPGGDARFVEDHLPLVRKLAQQVTHDLELRGWFDDLVGSGTEGLLSSRVRFDPSRGVKFTTFAYYRIRGAMLDAVRRSGYASAAAVRRARMMQMADDVSEGAADAPPGTRLTAAAAADALDNALKRISSGFVLEAVGQNPDSVENVRPDELFESAETKERVRAVLATLPERERTVLEAHYFGGRRFDEVAAELGVSKSWLSRIHWRGLDLLKQGLEREDIVER